MDDYNRGGHAKYSLKVHLIFVTKYRKDIFKSDIVTNATKQYFYDCAKKYNIEIIQIEADTDHIHILLNYCPEISVSYIAKCLKQYSTYYLWKTHPKYLAGQYWKKKILWSDGYFACSIGQVSQEVVEKYIQNQG